MLHGASDLDDPLNDLRNGKWVRFGTWKVMSLYRAGSMKTVASELMGGTYSTQGRDEKCVQYFG
jgi:hypothetical protein